MTTKAPSAPITKTEYAVQFNDDEPEVFTDLEQAIRVWDATAWINPVTKGYIGIQQWSGDLMVRDGFLIHVQDGFIYVSPQLKS